MPRDSYLGLCFGGTRPKTISKFTSKIFLLRMDVQGWAYKENIFSKSLYPDLGNLSALISDTYPWLSHPASNFEDFLD